MRKGCDVNSLDKYNETPLCRACFLAPSDNTNSDNMKILELLIANGANVNAKDNSAAPLFFAEATNIAKPLIAKGADIHIKTVDGNTLLHNFAKCNDKEMVLLYLDNGGDKTIENNTNKTASDIAKTEEMKDLINSYMQVITR